MKPDLPKCDAVVVGSGPNGLAAAIRLAQAGRSVLVVEAASTPGGGVRSAELTAPGFLNDVCSSVFPMAACSAYLNTLPLQEHGLEWIYPPAALAHPFEDGSAALLYKSVSQTAAALGRDAEGYKSLVEDLAEKWEELFGAALAPLRRIRSPFLMARFGLIAMRSVRSVAKAYFSTDRAQALFAGIGGHAMLPMEAVASAAPTIVLAVAGHAKGWPFARGGSQQLTNALVSYLKSLGGQLTTNWRVESLDELRQFRTIMLDVTPRQFLTLAGDRLRGSFRKRLERYRYGMGVFKVDWALSEPVPWKAKECRLAGTLHLGASLDEISASERRAWRGEAPDRPFIIFTQPSLFDQSRAPKGQHTAWGYCHVPHGYKGNAVDAIERQVERFAPGFRDCIVGRSVLGPSQLEAHNSNLIGGDIGGGAPTIDQLFFRPTFRLYGTPLKGVYLCSSSTPPGPGVHGLCGFFASELALRTGA